MGGLASARWKPPGAAGARRRGRILRGEPESGMMIDYPPVTIRGGLSQFSPQAVILSAAKDLDGNGDSSLRPAVTERGFTEIWNY